MTSTSLYMQFDPRQRYDQSDCLDPDQTSPSDDVSSQSSEGGESDVGAGAYAVTPVLHGVSQSSSVASASYVAFGDASEESSKSAPKRSASPAASSAASTTSSTLNTGSRQWNNEHQNLAKSQNWHRNYPQLAALTQQFQETAVTYGRLIISERALAPEQRSIKPINIGGVAGGDKYVHNGILFKFASDPVVAHAKGKPIYLFGGAQPDDEKAIKAMSRELLGADRYWGTFQNLLHYPLMCLIDHKGFRLLAMAVLPISHDTLVYGSDDGGRTVHTDDPQVNEVMKMVGERLNLKGHFVGLSEQHFIYGAGDVEVHHGTDGRYYVVDFARCSAPEAPPESGDRRTVFSKLLRPEFTRAYKKPLCADAFSRWDASRDDAVQHARDVVEATQYLYNEVVPSVARRLTTEANAIGVSLDVSEQLVAAGGYPKHKYVFRADYPLLDESDAPLEDGDGPERIEEADDDLDACVNSNKAPRPIGRRVSRLVAEQLEMLSDIIAAHRLHKEGVNMRHLGRIRAATTCPRTRMLILSVCVARVLKMQLNERLREQMRQLSLPADMPFKAVTSQFLAMVMRGFAGDQHFDTKQSRYFWRDELKRELETRFVHCLSDAEKADEFDLREVVSYKLIYSVFLQLTGLQLTEKALTHLWKSETTSFAVNRYDIIDVGSRWHSTQTYYVSAGISSFIYAMETDDSDGNRSVRRMLRDAFEQLHSGWQRSTEGGLPLVLMAATVSELAIRKRRRSRRNAEWRRAELWWHRAEETWKMSQIHRLHLRCLGNFRVRVLADIAALERRLTSVTKTLPPAVVQGARERAAYYREEKRRSSDSALKRSPSAPDAANAAAALHHSSPAPAAASLSSSSSSTPSPTPVSHGVFARSDSKVLAFEAYVRPRHVVEKKTPAQDIACNVTATLVALEEERDVLRRLDDEIGYATTKLTAFPVFDQPIVKAFDMLDSALNRDLCTVLPSGIFATNTRARRHV